MAFARGSRHDLSYVAESTFGATPGTPSMKRVRHTSTSLNLTKQSFTSEELRSDRMIEDFRHGTQQVGGDIAFEFSYGAFDDLLEGALFGTWAADTPALGSDQLKAGTTAKSFTMERRHTDIDQYLVFTGCMLNGLTLSVRPNGIVTGAFPVIGKGTSISGTSLGSPSDVATNSPFDSFSGSLQEGGSAIAVITAIELNLQNGLEPTFVVGSDETPQIIDGRSNLTGSISAYFEDATMLNKFVNETESSIAFVLADTDGNQYEFLIPRLKYSGGEAPVQGEGAITINMPFQALRATAENTNLQITRTAAV